MCLAPWAAEGLDWFARNGRIQRGAYTAAASIAELLTMRLVQAAAKIKADPASHVAALSPEMPGADRRVVADGGVRTLLAQNFAEALRDSADGWIDDVLAFCSPWGFELSDITGPVCSGMAEKMFSRRSRTRRWLADQHPARARRRSGRTALTSARSRWCRTCSPG